MVSLGPFPEPRRQQELSWIPQGSGGAGDGGKRGGRKITEGEHCLAASGSARMLRPWRRLRSPPLDTTRLLPRPKTLPQTRSASSRND